MAGELATGELFNVADLGHVLEGQHWLGHFKAHGWVDVVQVQQVGLWSNEAVQAHHQVFTDRVDRWVGHLREQLLEVVVQRLELVGHHGQWAVVAHGTGGLFAVLQHGGHQEFQVFLCVTESLLTIQQCFVRFDRLGLAFHFVELDADGVNPLLVGLGGAQLVLQLVVVDDAAGFHVDQEHLARLQAPFLDDLAFRNRQGARFRRHYDQIIFRHDVTCRAQAIAVECGTNLLAVGKRHGGGAVPGFHHGSVVFVEGATVVVHQGVLFPGLGHHHHHGLGNWVASHHQQFQAVVETRGVRLAFENQRIQLLQVVAQHSAFHHAFTRTHPVEVAFHGVDFTVVGQHAVRVGQWPLGECVGGETLVNQCQGRHTTWVFQVKVVLAHLVGQQQALVHNGTCAHGGAEVFGAMRQVQVFDGVHGALANHVQFAFQRVGHHDVAATAYKHLTNHGFFQTHGGAHGHVAIHRHVAPAQQDLALGFYCTLNFLFTGNT